MDSETNTMTMSGMPGKNIPHAVDVERQIIGGMLRDSEAILLASEKLTGDDFYLNHHQILYSVITEMFEENKPVDLITLTDTLNHKKLLPKIGGDSFLMELSAEVVSWANISFHCDIVKEKSLMRQLIKACNDILKNCYDGEEKALDVLDGAESQIFKIGENQVSDSMENIGSALKSTFQLIEKYSNMEVMGVPSGFLDLDKLTGGFQKTDLIVLAGRPAMGKTAVTLSMMANAALRSKKTIAFFSLEMGKEQLVQRILCREARINLQALRTGRLPKSEYSKLLDAAGKLHEARIYIDDSPNQTPLQIRSKCRRLKQGKDGLDMVIIDYLQLMSVGGRVENRTQEISQISRSLKGLAKELEIPVIALSQLNRSVESRSDGKPMLSDLRESGAIEQDADIVLFIFREEVYKPDDPTLKGKAEIIIAKQRNGPTGEANLTFVREYASFENFSDRPDMQGDF